MPAYHPSPATIFHGDPVYIYWNSGSLMGSIREPNRHGSAKTEENRRPHRSLCLGERHECRWLQWVASGVLNIEKKMPSRARAISTCRHTGRIPRGPVNVGIHFTREITIQPELAVLLLFGSPTSSMLASSALHFRNWVIVAEIHADASDFPTSPTCTREIGEAGRKMIMARQDPAVPAGPGRTSATAVSRNAT